MRRPHRRLDGYAIPILVLLVPPVHYERTRRNEVIAREDDLVLRHKGFCGRPVFGMVRQIGMRHRVKDRSRMLIVIRKKSLRLMRQIAQQGENCHAYDR